MLYALLIHAPSSKPNPKPPLRSARPSEIMRPVSVTTPAPMMTPRIPSSGLFESSLGIAAAADCAIRIGGTAMVDEAIGLFHQWRVRTVTTAESPGRNFDV